jgi:hypothetical protein
MKKTFFLLCMVFLWGAIGAGDLFAGQKVLIIPNKSSARGAIGTRTQAFHAACQRIESYFSDHGIGVFDEESMEAINREIERAGRIDVDIPDNDLIAMAHENNAGVLVKVEVFELPTPAGSREAGARVMASMFDVRADGRRIVMSEQYGRQLCLSAVGKKDAFVAAASKAGAKAGRRLYEKLKTLHPEILKSLLQSDEPTYRFAFLGYDESENDSLLEILYDDLGLMENQIHEMKVTPRLLEVEITMKSRLGAMVHKMKKISKAKGLGISEQMRDTGKVVFIKPGSDASIGKMNID